MERISFFFLIFISICFFKDSCVCACLFGFFGPFFFAFLPHRRDTFFSPCLLTFSSSGRNTWGVFTSPRLTRCSVLPFDFALFFFFFYAFFSIIGSGTDDRKRFLLTLPTHTNIGRGVRLRHKKCACTNHIHGMD